MPAYTAAVWWPSVNSGKVMASIYACSHIFSLLWIHEYNCDLGVIYFATHWSQLQVGNAVIGIIIFCFQHIMVVGQQPQQHFHNYPGFQQQS